MILYPACHASSPLPVIPSIICLELLVLSFWIPLPSCLKLRNSNRVVMDLLLEVTLEKSNGTQSNARQLSSHLEILIAGPVEVHHPLKLTSSVTNLDFTTGRQ